MILYGIHCVHNIQYGTRGVLSDQSPFKTDFTISDPLCVLNIPYSDYQYGILCICMVAVRTDHDSH